ncbi:MAG: amino acid racemase [Bacteroidota bacterium]
MKKIGLVGGISWTSTVDYYRFINEETNRILGGVNFAECIIYSLNFEKFSSSNAAYDWEGTFKLLLTAVKNLEKAGAEVIMLGANTAHIVAELIAEKTDLPIIDIRSVTAEAIRKQNISKVGLLGTSYTMELDFYKNKLLSHGVEAIVPAEKQDRDYIEETLVQELGKGVVAETTKREYIRIANTLINQGAEAIVLGCTEIPLLLSQEDFNVPVFNTTQIHAESTVKFALSTEAADKNLINE